MYGQNFASQTQHEKKHIDKAKEVANTITADDMKLTGEAQADTYDASFDAAKAEFLKQYTATFGGAELSKQLTAAHAKFDKTTKHGASQGAKLDTSIK